MEAGSKVHIVVSPLSQTFSQHAPSGHPHSKPCQSCLSLLAGILKWMTNPSDFTNLFVLHRAYS
jgi:hypothetical protein